MVSPRGNTPVRGVATTTAPNQRPRMSQPSTHTSTPVSSSRHRRERSSGCTIPATAPMCGLREPPRGDQGLGRGEGAHDLSMTVSGARQPSATVSGARQPSATVPGPLPAGGEAAASMTAVSHPEELSSPRHCIASSCGITARVPSALRRSASPRRSRRPGSSPTMCAIPSSMGSGREVQLPCHPAL